MYIPYKCCMHIIQDRFRKFPELVYFKINTFYKKLNTLKCSTLYFLESSFLHQINTSANVYSLGNTPQTHSNYLYTLSWRLGQS